jgi:phage major head subunit gpT-like protein
MSESRLTAPLILRGIKPRSTDIDNRTIEMTWTTGSSVERYGPMPDGGRGRYLESLSLAPGHVDLARLNEGAPLLNSHNAFDVRAVIGVVENAEIRDGVGVATVRFSERDEAQAIFKDVTSGILRNVSVGYDIQGYTDITPKDSNTRHFQATNWTPLELSIVSIPADAGAQFRAAGETSITMEASMAEETGAIVPAVDEAAIRASILKEVADTTRREVEAERTRIATILDLAKRGRHEDEWAQRHIRDSSSLEVVRESSLALLHERTSEPINSIVRVEGGYDADEPVARREAMAVALAHRHAPQLIKLEPGSRATEYVGWTMRDMVVHNLGLKTRNTREVFTRAMHTTSDFPLLLESALSKVMMGAYQQATPTFRQWAAQRTFSDFRPHGFYRPGDYPNLELNPEAAEITLGTMGETKEAVSVLKYARRIAFTLELMVNDDLGFISDMATMAGRRAADKENQLVYAELAKNSGSGPNLRDGNPMCTTARTNKAAAGTAITVASVSAARAALRKMTSTDGLKLNINAAIVLVGPDKETEAMQFFTTSIVPVTDVTSNPFKGSVAIVVDANITGNNWYLIADPGILPVMVWGYLSGYEGLTFDTMQGWTVAGVEYRAMLVFGTGGIDWRGIYHNPGA